MEINKKKYNKNKQIAMVIFFVCMFGVSGFIIYKNFIKSGSGQPVLIGDSNESTTRVGEGGGVIQATEELKNNKTVEKDFFSQVLVKKFKKYGDWPQKQSAVGKINPFLPSFTN